MYAIYNVAGSLRHSYAECAVAALGKPASVGVAAMQCVGLGGVLVTYLVLIGSAVTTVAPSIPGGRWTGTGIAFVASLPLVSILLSDFQTTIMLTERRQVHVKRLVYAAHL